jgi:hypothetical protein
MGSTGSARPDPTLRAVSSRAVRLLTMLPPGGAAALEPGRDLLLPDDPAAADAPVGTLLNDWLDAEARVGAQEDAEGAMAAWRERVDAPLTRNGICLPHVHTGNLQADVFLAAARIATGLPAFTAAERPARMEIHGADRDLAVALVAALEAAGVKANLIGGGPLPRYPIGFARSVRRGRLAPLREALGFPGRPRGVVLIQPFRHLRGLWAALPARGVDPVLDPALLPPLSARELVARAWRGGFIGHPGSRALRRSRAALGQALASVGEPPPSQASPLVALGEQRALELIRQLASGTFALAGAFRAAVRRGLRTAVVPSDTAPYARTFTSATRELGSTLVTVQHGFCGDLWRVGGKLVPYADGVEAERVAVWSERDEQRLRGFARGEITVTGNPDAGESPPTAREPGRTALVLLQPAGASELIFDVRAARRYVEEALAGLAAARFSGPVVLRPHPLDRMDYRGLETHGLRTSVDAGSSLPDALRGARLCVGTLSTATLEAVRAGVPTVFLDVAGVPLPWPFDGSGALPRATDRESLADALGALGKRPGDATQAAAAEALGARPGALGRVADLVVAATR